MPKEKDRRNKCKCGKFFYWGTDERTVKCPHCGIEYKVDCDSVLVYWLEEKVVNPVPYKTVAR